MMKSSEAIYCIIFGLIISSALFITVESLIWSRFTLMQVVCCVSWPIPYKNPLRKLFFNVGLQFNYAEPFALSNFYNATYFQNIFNSRDLRGESDSLSKMNMSNQSGSESNTIDDPNIDIQENRMQSRSLSGGQDDLIGSDLTAAQLYESIEDNFSEIGYDKSCLQKAICELARHPFHKVDEDEHLLLDIINFVLTPTEHNGFAEHEPYERGIYETAQKIGKHGHDCDEVYPECDKSILNNISYLMTT